MKSLFWLFTVCMGILVSATGCATIMHGNIQDVSVVTRPAGVIATIDTQSCVTPCTLVGISRKSGIVKFTEGTSVMPYKLDISTNVGWNIFGNLASWGLIGWKVDAATGARRRIENINFTLHRKINDPVDPNEDELAMVQ